MPALPYALLYLIPTVAAALLAIYAWRLRYYRSGRPFALLMGALAFWCCCRVLAIIDPSFEGTVFWALMQVGGIALIMPAWLIVALSYTGQRWRRHLPLLAAIFVPAGLFFLIALTNSFHGLWWSRVEPDLRRGFMWIDVAWGPGFWAHSIYAYSCFVVSLVLIARSALRTQFPERGQALLMLGASLLPAVGNLAFLLGIRPHLNEDPTPILLLVGASVALFATLHFRVVDLSPLVEQVVVEALPDGMIVLDNAHVVVEINAAACELLGVSVRHAVGQSLATLLAGSALGMAMRPALSSLQSPHAHHVAYEGPGGLYTVELRSRPLLAINGAVAGTLLLLRDVSERARAEQAQAQHLAELNLLTRVARAANTALDAESLVRVAAATITAAGLWERVAVGLLTPDGAHLRVAADLAAEGLAESYEGLHIDGPAGITLLAIMRAGHTADLNLDDEAVAASPLGQAMDCQGLRRLVAVPLFHQGAPLGVLLLGNLTAISLSPALPRVAETIGELITDAVVRAGLYDEVRQADRLKASFLASVSHELRTPLTSIIGYVEMLQRGVFGQLPDRALESLGYMRLSSIALLRMINDILDFSRAEAGHLVVDLGPVHLSHVVGNVVGQLQPQIRERGLAFELAVDPELPAVWAHQGRLEQVVSNLLSNALKFTDTGQLTVRAWRAQESVRLSVADTGVGIAPADLELIFQEFRRVEIPGRRVGGTGLGLAISRRLVALMGGQLRVTSEVGVGSTFTIELPVVAGDATTGYHSPFQQEHVA